MPEVAKTACPNAKKPRRKYDEPSYPMDYFHPDFKRGRKDLLPLILRKLREHAEVTDGSVPSAGASPATTTNGLEEEAAILEAKQAVDLPQQPEQYIRDCLAEDTWKAILGPVLSNERNTAPDGPQESPNCPAASGFSTPSASPEENDFNPFTSFFTYEPPRFQPKEGSSPVDSLNTLMTNLPEDPATLRSLLQQTQMLSSQIQERLFGTCATWLVKSSAQVPEHAAWNLLSTGWSHPLSAQQHSSNDMPFSAPGPSRPESAVPIFIQSALPL